MAISRAFMASRVIWKKATQVCQSRAVCQNAAVKVHHALFRSNMRDPLGHNVRFFTTRSSTSGLQTGRFQCTGTLKYHTQAISSALFLPNGALASSAEDTTIKIKNVNTQDLPTVVDSNQTNTQTMALLAPTSPNWLLVTGTSRGTIPVWDLTPNDKGEWYVLGPHKDMVDAVAGLPNGNIVSGSWDKTVCVWNPSWLNPLVQTCDAKSPVYALCVLNGGNSVASGSQNGLVTVWPIQGTSRQIVLPHQGAVRSLLSMPNGWQFVSGGDDTMLRMWDISQKNPLVFSLKTPSSITALAVLPDGNSLITGHETGDILLWDMLGQKLLYTLPKEHDGLIRSFAVQNGETFFSGSNDKTIKRWDLRFLSYVI